MKVKIFTEGGENIGLGHISRCSSLYHEVVRRRMSVDFVVCGNIIDVDFLKGINIINENWLNKEYIRNNISSDDYIIIDSYKAEKEIYECITKLSKKAVFIDDIGRIQYPKGIIVNPSLDASNINYSQSQDSIILSGPEYVILRSPFIGVKKKRICNQVKRVLIMMGGMDIRGLTPLIVNNICRKRLDIEFDIVLGSDDIGDFQNQSIDNSNISIYINIKATQIKKLMLNADLAITAAGQTIYELLITHTPFIPIQVIENQENNIRSLLKYNPEQIVLKYDDEHLFNSILKALETNNICNYKKEQNEKYNGIVDGNGVKKIIDKLLEDM